MTPLRQWHIYSHCLWRCYAPLAKLSDASITHKTDLCPHLADKDCVLCADVCPSMMNGKCPTDPVSYFIHSFLFFFFLFFFISFGQFPPTSQISPSQDSNKTGMATKSQLTASIQTATYIMSEVEETTIYLLLHAWAHKYPLASSTIMSDHGEIRLCGWSTPMDGCCIIVVWTQDLQTNK